MIKMEALKQMFVDLGFQHVQTYIQSGNIVFQTQITEVQKLEKKITTAITEKFGFAVPVIVKEISELKQIIADNPFSKDNTKDIAYLHVTFLSENPEQKNYNKLDAIQCGPDDFQLVGKAIYLYCPNGYGNSKLSNSFFETKLKVTATTRNWKTTNELYNLACKISD